MDMEYEDLIKKLESIELPQIEIESRRRRLRMALLSSDYYFKKPSFLEIFRKSLAFSIPTLVLLIILGVTVIQPKLIEAKALGIAKSNPEIKKLMEEKNMDLSEVKVKDGKAYILLNPPKESEPLKTKPLGIKITKTEKDEIEGAIVEVNLNQKKVTKIDPINWDNIAPLDSEEKESAQEITKQEEILQDIIPKEAKITKIQSSLPSNIRLVEKDHEVEVKPHSETEKKAQVHYVLNGKEWVIKVNLTDKKVEEVQYSTKNQSLKGRK